MEVRRTRKASRGTAGRTRGDVYDPHGSPRWTVIATKIYLPGLGWVGANGSHHCLNITPQGRLSPLWRLQMHRSYSHPFPIHPSRRYTDCCLGQLPLFGPTDIVHTAWALTRCASSFRPIGSTRHNRRASHNVTLSWCFCGI